MRPPASPQTFALRVSLRVDGDEHWTANCDRCHAELCAQAPTVEVARQIVDSFAHVCATP